MIPNLIHDKDYKKWLSEVKGKIRASQIKAAMAVNTALIEFYWDLGKMIHEKQTAWGTSFLERLSKDLKDEFPDMKGFSVTNLKYCKLFYNYFSNRPQIGDENQKKLSPQVGDESSSPIDESIKRIPWGHIKLIINKLKEREEAFFYIQKQWKTTGAGMFWPCRSNPVYITEAEKRSITF